MWIRLMVWLVSCAILGDTWMDIGDIILQIRSLDVLLTGWTGDFSCFNSPTEKKSSNEEMEWRLRGLKKGE